jgi:hypothetical protein
MIKRKLEFAANGAHCTLTVPIRKKGASEALPMGGMGGVFEPRSEYGYGHFSDYTSRHREPKPKPNEVFVEYGLLRATFNVEGEREAVTLFAEALGFGEIPSDKDHFEGALKELPSTEKIQTALAAAEIKVSDNRAARKQAAQEQAFRKALAHYDGMSGNELVKTVVDKLCNGYSNHPDEDGPNYSFSNVSKKVIEELLSRMNASQRKKATKLVEGERAKVSRASRKFGPTSELSEDEYRQDDRLQARWFVLNDALQMIRRHQT